MTFAKNSRGHHVAIVYVHKIGEIVHGNTIVIQAKLIILYIYIKHNIITPIYIIMNVYTRCRI